MERLVRADSIEKFRMVENLLIVRSLEDMKKLPKKVRGHSFASMLNSLFEDLENDCYIKYGKKK